MAKRSHLIEMLIRVRDEASRKMGLIGKSSRALGGHLRYLAAGLGAYIGVRQIGSILKFGMEFEKTMSRVGVLSQSTAEDQERLIDTAKRLGATTAFTAKQAADGMNFLALAGFKVNEIIRAMPATLNLAAAGQLEIAQAADITAKIMKGLGISADDVGFSVDVLARAFTTANTDLVQLGEAMSYVGPIGRTAGKDLVELTAAIQVMSNAGVQASQAGTALRQILTALSKGSSAAEKGLAKLEIETVGLDGALKPLPDIIDDFNRAMEGMGKAEQTATLMQIFGKRAGPGMAAMLNEGSKAIRDYEKDLRAAGGTAQKIADVQLNNVAGSLTKIGSALADIKLSFYDMQQSPLKSWLDDLTITLQGVAFDIRNMGDSWDIAMTAMTLSAMKAAREIWTIMSFLPPGMIYNLGRKITGKPSAGGELAENIKVLQNDLFNLSVEREKKFHAELRGGLPGAPGAVGAGAAGGEKETIGGAIVAALRGSLRPVEGRLLTFAPGQAAAEDPAVRVARQQLEVEKESRRLLVQIADALTPMGTPSPATVSLRAARFEN